MTSLINNNKEKFRIFLANETEGDDLFTEFWNKSSKQILKFECRQFYNVEEPAYDFYINNDIENMICDIVNFWKDEKEKSYKRILEKEIDFFRLHVIRNPISKYIESEYYSYLLSELIGEKIRCIDFDNVIDKDLLDFVVFDEKMMMITIYNEEDEPLEDWYTDDEEIIHYFHSLFFSLYESGENYRMLLSGDKDIEYSIITKFTE